MLGIIADRVPRFHDKKTGVHIVSRRAIMFVKTFEKGKAIKRKSLIRIASVLGAENEANFENYGKEKFKKVLAKEF